METSFDQIAELDLRLTFWFKLFKRFKPFKPIKPPPSSFPATRAGKRYELERSAAIELSDRSSAKGRISLRLRLNGLNDLSSTT
jgi:hypothetical protein